MGIIVDVSHFYKRRDARLDARGKPKAKKQFNMDFEVGVYAPDEPGDKTAGKSGGNTRLPYGLCKSAGIDTTGMTPAEAWAALAGETGISAKKAYSELEKAGDAKGLAKEVKEKVKEKKSEEPEEEEEDITPDIEAKREEAASRFKAAVDMATDRETVIKILEGVPVGGIVHYTPIDKHGAITEKDATATRNADGSWTTDIGTEVSTSRLSWWVNRDRKRGKPFSLEADDFTMPTDGEKLSAPATPAKAAEPAETEKAVTTDKGTHYIIPAAPAITGTKIPVKTTPEIDTSKVKTMMNADATRELWSATHKNYDKYKDDVTAGMKYLFDTNEFCMNINPSIVQSILEKGFLNQFQTKKDSSISHKTSGASNLPLRKKASQNMFGTPPKTKAEDFEKYGYLGNPLKPSTEAKGYAGGYGSATVIFKKDRVKNRLTYSIEDSLYCGSEGTAVPGKDGDATSYEGVGFDGLGYAGTVSQTMKAIMDAPSKKSGLEDIIKWGYMELQYHGPLTMSDAEAIVFRSAYDYHVSITPDVQEALDALGIKVIKLFEKKT